MLNWRELNEQIGQMTEQELKDMLAKERRTLQRSSVLVRLHQRYTAVRAARERKELLDDRRHS